MNQDFRWGIVGVSCFYSMISGTLFLDVREWVVGLESSKGSFTLICRAWARMTQDGDYWPDNVNMASPCGLTSSKHGGLKADGLVIWQVRTMIMSIAMNKMETELPFMTQTDLKRREFFMGRWYIRHSTIYDILYYYNKFLENTNI